MAEKEYTDEEIVELDGFLQNEFNYDTYRELIGEGFEGYKDLFEPLEFFRLFSSHSNFIVRNSSKPLTVSLNLKKLNLSNEQLYFLCDKLIDFVEDRTEDFYFAGSILPEISRLRDKLNVFQNQKNPVNNLARKFDFAKVKRYIDGLSNKNQISYLIEKKTEYLQETDSVADSESGIKFDKKCDLEIEKIDKTHKASLYYDVEENEEDEPSEDNEASEFSKQVRNRDLTLDQTVLFFSYLFTFVKVNSHNKNKAEVISALTGFSENTIQQQLSSIYKKANDNPKAYQKDMKIVRSKFESIDLTSITSLIDKDLSFK